MRERNRDQSTKGPKATLAPRSHALHKFRIFIRLRTSLLPLPAIVLLTGASWVHVGASSAPWDAPVTEPGASSPIADWTDDLDDDIGDAEDDLREAADAIGWNPGPLSDPDLSIVEGRLDQALAAIDRVLDPDRYPRLEPPDAGSVDTNANPVSLPEYARECLDRIRDAHDALGSDAVDQKVVGSQLRTIRHLITRSSPHSYRSMAGIASEEG
jgi:hypothetical protein